MSSDTKHLKSLLPPQILGERFKEQREALGWSIEELASKTTFSKKQIEQIENGLSSSFYSSIMKFNAAKKIAEVLQLEQQDAFELTDVSNTITSLEPLPNPKQSDQELYHDPSDTLINISIPVSHELNPELERSNARNTLQLKMLVICLLFLGVLFVFHNSDSFSTIISPKQLKEKQIMSTVVTEESINMNHPQTAETQSVDTTPTPKKSE